MSVNVEALSALRRKCREASVEYVVVKNTLARIAAKEAGWEELVEHLRGPSAVAYTKGDASSPARIISEFAKKTNKPKIKVSLFEGQFYGPDRIEEIASLPSKEVLIARLLGSFNAPVQGFVGTLNGLVQKMVGTIDAVRAKRESASEV